MPLQQGRVAATNIVDRIGPKDIVPQHLDAPLDAFTLTFPDELDIPTKTTKYIVVSIQGDRLFRVFRDTDQLGKRTYWPFAG